MQMARFAAFILSAIFLSPALNGQRPSDARPVIACFGDSITAGYGIDDPGKTYPADLQRMLDGEGFHYRVLNEGVSGNTTKDAVNRVAHVLARHPQIVVLEFGGNDGLRGLPLSQTEANLASVLQQLQSAHVQVAVAGITLPPQYGGDYIARFNAIFPNLAKRFHVPLLAMILTDVYGIPGNIQQDGVHPTAKGAEGVARNVEHLIRPLLAK